MVVPTHIMNNPQCREPSKISLTCADNPIKISPAWVYVPEETIMDQMGDHKSFISSGKLVTIFY